MPESKAVFTQGVRLLRDMLDRVRPDDLNEDDRAAVRTLVRELQALLRLSGWRS